MSGKTTLSKRIELSNNSLKALCDDGVLVDLKNSIAYPIPYFWFDQSSLFNEVNIPF